MIIRQLQYVLALAQTEHFARAAALCQVSQPSLSTAIQQLEKELGVVLVQRGQRFQGFTPEGQRLMPWIRRLVADWEALQAEASNASDGCSGSLRIGVIPTAVSLVSVLTARLQAQHPGVTVVVRSLATEAIIRSLRDFEIDCGIAYRQERPRDGFQTLPLYDERYMLLCPERHALAQRPSLTWTEAASLPLCLLTQNMQNRRNVDEVFSQHGLTAQVRLETDSIVALASAVHRSGLFSIVPHSVVSAGDGQPGVVAVPLTPAVASRVELLALTREPVPSVIERLWTIARASDLQALVDGALTGPAREPRAAAPTQGGLTVGKAGEHGPAGPVKTRQNGNKADRKRLSADSKK